MVVLLPGGFPLLLLLVDDLDRQRPEVNPFLRRRQAGEVGLDLGEGLVAVGGVGQVEFHLGVAVLHLLHQALVHIVPVDGGIGEKVLEVGRILDHHLVDAVGHQEAGDNFNPFGGGLDADFCPVHSGSRSFLFD